MVLLQNISGVVGAMLVVVLQCHWFINGVTATLVVLLQH
jgi:hypothetical protein